MILSILKACLLVLLAVWTIQVLGAFVILGLYGLVRLRRAFLRRMRAARDYQVAVSR